MKPAFLAFLSLFLTCCMPADQEENIRESIQGVWVASPTHNEFLHSEQHIMEGMAKLDSLGINTIFLCVWADNQTAWKSDVLLQNGNYGNLDSTSFYSKYDYGDTSFDPVRVLLDEAHSRGIEVHFWFEYGFMAAWGSAPDSTNHPILARHPEWLGLDNQGLPANYNGNDFYYNSFDPEVQSFLLMLVKEALNKYPDVDGIQGDDRMPASPANSGYNRKTIDRYVAQTGNTKPGSDFRDQEWYQWRIDMLNSFAQRFYEAANEGEFKYSVSFSPNPYPWSYENLMQDWPTWLEHDVVDLLAVQCYRRTFRVYEATLQETLTYVGEDRGKFIPGLILGTGAGAIANQSSLDSMIGYNQRAGLAGQSYFYVKWILEDSVYGTSISRGAELFNK